MSRRNAYTAFAEVALPVPLPRTFSYGIPAELLRARPGARVRVGFGARALIGCITEVRTEEPDLPKGTKLLPIVRLLDDEPVLDAKNLELVRFIADYYLASPGLVCRAMLPPETPRGERLVYECVEGVERSGERGLAAQVLDALSRPMTARALARAAGKKSVSGTLATLLRAGLIRQRPESPKGGGRRIRTAAITNKGREALADGKKLDPTAIRVLTLLSVATDPVAFSTIRNELKIERGPFASMERRGFIVLGYDSLAQTPWARLRASSLLKRPELTPCQEAAVREIVGAANEDGFRPILLWGVTGSGKTEVYMRAAEDVLARGRSVLILVPEIALTPRLAADLHGRFGDRVAILHSALGSGERRDEWWRIRHGEARVVVGARAAVFAPTHELGLVVVDEEHEASYKQEENPRYNARDVAILRARNENAVVVLGSATPSIESFTHAVDARYRLLELPDRIGNRPLAVVDFIDMRSVVRDEGPDTVLAAPLREAIAARLAGSEQAMVLLNRRGYAGQLLCRQCGLALMCTECSVAMTLHRGARLAVCHYCGLGRGTPERCETCSGEYLRRVGYGTERVEELVRELFPESIVARMDRDTMRKKGSYETLLARFAAQEIDILVGTQMLAKGHDFPAVTLVGVLAADNGLGAPDFRAAERTFQLLTQVAGRAGRGHRPGQVLIQTFAPDHYSLQFAQAQNYKGFYEMERKFRAALRYPPVVRLINIVVEGDSMAEATSRARNAASFLRRNELEGVKVLGPAFAVRSKVANRHRCQVLLKVPRQQHAQVRSRLRHLLSDEATAKVMVVDVDPIALS